MICNSKSIRPHEAAKLVEEVSQLSDDEAYTLHGIEFYENDAVYDTIDDISYNTLLDWANAQLSAMYDAKFEKRCTPHANED
jgi:hypothetical protein